jgi:predicted nucleic acid-binding protein
LIVVDTNVIAYLLIEGEKTPLAQEAYRQDGTWLVPGLWKHEFLNVLATFGRQGGANLDELTKIWWQATSFFIRREQEPDMELALRLAYEKELSAYDAQFAAVAIESGVRLVTEDQQLLRAFPDIALSLADFCTGD